MRKTYEKPFIKKEQGGITNKFGEMRIVSPSAMSGFNVDELVQKYGSPLFVYSEAAIKDRHRLLMDSFLLRYPRVQHAWSYKTNYLKAICRTFHAMGSWAEVVSEMEYNMAKRNGVDARHIVLNGPFKPYHLLKEAISGGAMVNIDSMDELYDVERIADELGAPVNVGIRVNMALGAYMAWDRFGFNIESGHAAQALKRAKSGGKVNITGLHAHVGTFIFDPDIYRIEAEKLAEFSRMTKDYFGEIRYIDIGGGFASHNNLKGSYLPTSEMVPSFERYAEAVCDTMLGLFKPEELPLLILETGRALIDEAGMLISSVCAAKRLGNGMRAIVIDAGVNILITAFWYDHDVVPASDKGYSAEDHVIYGPLCMQIDVIRPLIKLPYLEKGDKVIIKPVGAYNNTQWMQFINLRPNVLMVSEKGEVAVIRHAETIDYLQEMERLPEWLKD